jgi:hypothetical protein
MAITSRMQEIATEYQNGASLEYLAAKYGITEGSVREKIDKVKRFQKHAANPRASADPEPRWWLEDKVKAGVTRYKEEHGRLPSAQDFDECEYLPSARQVQRVYGGMAALRQRLGFGDIDLTKGKLRGDKFIQDKQRSAQAEKYIETTLLLKFGEPFVHRRKRCINDKSTYDLLVYAQDRVFGVDVFTTERAAYIGNNLRFKLQKFEEAPSSVDIYFVLVGKYSSADLRSATQGLPELARHTNMHAVTENEFREIINGIPSLKLPTGFVGLT